MNKDLDKYTQIVAQWLGSGSINLFGSPHAGKDTQCRRLGARFNAPVISGGDILRTRKDIPSEVMRHVDGGDLAPTDFYRQMIQPYFKRPEFASKPLILSSVGRDHGEEPIILEAAESGGHPVKAVVLLKLGEEVIWQRWRKHHQEGSDRGTRADDTEEALQFRLQRFHESTMKVIEFYRSNGLLIEVDGEGSPAEVEARIIAALAQKAE